jgi:hypothetical protein
MNRRERFAKRAPRVDLRRPAIVIDSDGRSSPVTVLDVSSGGFRIEASESLHIGEFVRLLVEHSEDLPAQIRWVLGNEAGGVFLTELGSEFLGKWGDGK